MSLSLNNSTIVPLLSGEVFLGKEYDNILDFAEINIGIKCDVGYDLTYIYSQDKLTIDYQTTQSITAQVDTQFYKVSVNNRYFKLKIEATDGDMSVLNVQTIYKSSTTFNNSGAGPTSNVDITGPLNGDGSVRVGGSLTLGGSIDANITNASLDVAVSNFPATQPVSGSVDVNNFPTTQDVNITNTSLDVTVSNFPTTQDVSDADTHTKLDTINTNLINTYNILNTKGTATLFNNVSTGVNGFSAAVDLSNKKIFNITFMGKSSGATLLTVQFSSDGVTYFDSQYSYNFTGAGSFGYNINGCPNYLRMKSSNDVIATVIVNYC